jgi:superfamily II DNA or RNA helicase/diadenosine tetraphosphate (Ap4A) HIT family hydrolase/HKD family nuclease
MDCPFCNPIRMRCIWENSLARALLDGYPVTDGHVLIVPKRHVARFHDLELAEREALWAGVDAAWPLVRGQATDFNLGVNDGPLAGQTVAHLHMHLIPRRSGDTPDPTGGVRGVIPERRDWRRFRNYPPAERRTLLASPPDGPLASELLSALDSAVEVDVAVAFVTSGGLELVASRFAEILSRPGARIRFLTGDYLGFNEPHALRRLLEFGEGLQAFVLQSDQEGGFHGKAFLLKDGQGTRKVLLGSSNLTRGALLSPLEWNLSVDDHLESKAVHRAFAEFERLLVHPRTVRLDARWIDQYAMRRRPVVQGRPDARTERDFGSGTAEPETAIVATPVQAMALDRLDFARASGERSGLVVMATGLGKTFLAAMHRKRQGDRACLFVAHRREILTQAMSAFRRTDPDARLARLEGGEVDPAAEVVFASVQSLSRLTTLERLDPARFHLLVVDEFHHALAPTYRRVIDHFNPRFLLGLTATPERGDRGDILALCGDNLIYECNLFEGIERSLLSPFDYFGIADVVDYSQIPWRNGKFDERALENVVATESRARRSLEEWSRHIGPGRRSLGFCASIRHADFTREHFLRTRPELRIAVVHGGERSDPREASLDALRHGRLDLLLSVDMFNEGVDVPEVDGVLLLRPTESPTIFLQQLGRGLRRRPGKRLTVVDFVGNHRSFLVGLMALTGAEPGRELSRILSAAEDGSLTLPAGCRVQYDLAAMDLLRQWAVARNVRERIQDWYDDYCERMGNRPSFREAMRSGFYRPGGGESAVGVGSWLDVLERNGAVPELVSLGGDPVRELLEVIQKTKMTKSFKMLVLEAFAEQLLPSSLSMDRIMEHFRRRAGADPRVRVDLEVDVDDSAALRGYIRRNPIAALTGSERRVQSPIFSWGSQSLSLVRPVPESSREVVSGLMLEIVEARLWSYFNRPGKTA